MVARSSSLSRQSVAAMFSASSRSLRIPTRLTVTAGFPSAQAIANCATDLPYPSANSASRRVARTVLWNGSPSNCGSPNIWPWLRQSPSGKVVSSLNAPVSIPKPSVP